MTSVARRRGSWAGIVLLAAGLGVTTWAVAQGQRGGASQPAWQDASARARVGYAPDPPPMRSADQWVLTFRYSKGKVDLLSSRRVRLKKAVTTPRRIGRYAVELLSGPTVIERVRFDFPLLGADELAGQQRPYLSPPRFESKATVTYRVMLPDTPRASRARFVDRATAHSFMIPWPPGSATPAASASAGSGSRPDAGKDAAADTGKDADADTGTDAQRDAPSDAPRRPDARRGGDASAPDAAPLDGGRAP